MPIGAIQNFRLLLQIRNEDGEFQHLQRVLARRFPPTPPSNPILIPLIVASKYFFSLVEGGGEESVKEKVFTLDDVT